MSSSDEKHVFVSYVHEDSARVDELCNILKASRIPYWRDRGSLGPGDAWKAKIRDAIRGGALVFLCCFSDNSRAKEKSHMNEEITLAVEEYRKMSPGRTWLIPVRFDSGSLPEWDLGAGRVLSDLNYADLFGPGLAAEAAALVTTIHGVMGEKQLGAAQALEAVEQATAADRVDLLKRLTKEMLLDPQRRIQLDDLVSQEAQRVVVTLTDSGRVAGPLGTSGEDQVVRLAEEANELWMLCAPFCASLQVAARWGPSQSVSPWVNGIRSFAGAANKTASGVQSLTELRHIPAVASVMTAAIASVTSGNWENLRVLVAEPSARDRYQAKTIPLLEATDPYAPFKSSELVAHTLAHSAVDGVGLKDAISDFSQNRKGKLFTPVADWLHHVLRPLFLDQIPDQETYDAEFDRAEVMLGFVSTDAIDARVDSLEDRWRRSRWFGRSLWRTKNHHGNPIEEFTQELAAQRTAWGPLRAGLFGGDVDRARAAMEKYSTDFADWSRNFR